MTVGMGGLTMKQNIKANITKRLNHGNFSGRRDLLDGLLKSQYRDGHTLPLGEIAYVHMPL